MECPICLEPITKGYIVTECCQKQFHTKCHQSCMKIKSSCPMCRSIPDEFKSPIEEEPVNHNLVYIMSIILSISTVIVIGIQYMR
jgi:hypothetical protein